MYTFRRLVSIQFLITIFILLSHKHSKVNGFGVNLIKVPSDDISQVICSMALLRKYYNSGESLSGSVLYMSLTTASMHTQKRLLEAIHAMTDYPWSIVIRNPKNLKSMGNSNVVLHEKPQCYFVIIENLENEDLEDIFEDWKTTINWNPLAQFVVYLSSVEETDDEMTELMIEILLSFMNKKIYNVNVFAQSDEIGFFYGKTAFPYHPDNNCGNRVISIETLDVCDYRVGERTENNVDEDSSNFGENDDGNENVDKYNDDDDDDDDRTNDGNGGESNPDENEEKIDGEEHKYDDYIEKEIDENYNKKMYPDVDENHEKHKEDLDEDNELEGGLVEETSNVGNHDHEILKDNENSGNDDTIEDASISKGIDQKNNSIYHEKKRNELPKYGHVKATMKSRKISKIKIGENPKKYYIKNEIKSFYKIKQNKYKSILKNNAQRRDFSRHPYKLQKFMRLETKLDSDISEENNTSKTNDEPNFYFGEIFRALFLDKFPRDLSGCPLAAAYRPWEPYVFEEMADSAQNDIDENNTETQVQGNNDYNSDSTLYDDNNQHFQFDGLSEYAAEVASSTEDNRKKILNGIEYELLKTIGERLHITINLQVENSNLYHLFQELIDGDIEMVIGGIDEDPSMSQYVSTTIPYHQDDLTWCVAKARRSHSLFNFLASFSLYVWLVTFLYIFVSSLTIIWLQRVLNERINHLKGFSSVLLRIFGSIFNQSMPIDVKRRPLRIVFFSTFFMGLMFMNAYQSSLISTLTTPKSAYQIKKIEEIYENRMIIKGSVDNVRHLNKEGEIFKYIRENFQMCYNIEECLIEAADNENIAVAVSRQHSFYNPRIPRNRLYCFDRNENIYVYLVTMLLPKKFHLLHKINPVIQHVIESGHMQKWARDLDMRRRIHEERNYANDDKFRSLTLGQVVGTFVFTSVLLGIAFMVLILECCVHRLATRRCRRRLKIVKFLHRQFLRA